MMIVDMESMRVANEFVPVTVAVRLRAFATVMRMLVMLVMDVLVRMKGRVVLVLDFGLVFFGPQQTRCGGEG